VVYEDRPTPETAQTGAPRVPAVQPPTRTSRLAVIGPSPGVVRTAPYRVAPPVTELPPAQRVQVSAVATNGWRVVMLPDGRVGYVEDAALRLE
jgi:hypothetical protein